MLLCGTLLGAGNMIEGISTRMAFPYRTPNIQYDQTTVKAVVRVNGDTQQSITYTYDNKGFLVQSIVRSHLIGEV
jgi:hypothetical protein